MLASMPVYIHVNHSPTVCEDTKAEIYKSYHFLFSEFLGGSCSLDASRNNFALLEQLKEEGNEVCPVYLVFKVNANILRK